MPARSRLLIAVTPMGFAHAKRALHRRYELVSAFSLEQALASLDAGGIDAPNESDVQGQVQELKSLIRDHTE